MSTTPHQKQKDPSLHRTRREQIQAAALTIAREDGESGDYGEEQQESLTAQMPVESTQAVQKKGGHHDLPPSPLVTPPTASRTAPFQADVSTMRMTSSVSPSGKKGGGGGGVPHIYHDYAQVPDEPGYIRKKTGGVTQPFPEKLYEMLESEALLHGDVVEWLPHGRAFIVRRPKEFTDRIMPKYFRQSKLTSFQRQLNLYGFRRLTQGPDGGAYYHEMFLRGRPALCCRMKRQKVKGTGHKQPADANTEPNFYEFPFVAVEETEKGERDSQGGANQMAQASTSASRIQPLASPQTAAMSPGIASIHGAAHLLRRIASDERSAPFASLPPSAPMASSSTAVVRSGQESLEPPRGAYFLRQHFVPTEARSQTREVKAIKEFLLHYLSHHSSR